MMVVVSGKRGAMTLNVPATTLGRGSVNTSTHKFAQVILLRVASGNVRNVVCQGRRNPNL